MTAVIRGAAAIGSFLGLTRHSVQRAAKALQPLLHYEPWGGVVWAYRSDLEKYKQGRAAPERTEA